jgi:hypothetical protein
MPITPKALLEGQEASRRIKSYERHPRWMQFTPVALIPLSVISYFVRPDALTAGIIFIWVLMLILVIYAELTKKRRHLDDLALVAQLREKYGEDVLISFYTIPPVD